MAVGVMSTGGLLVRVEPEEVEALIREPGVGTFGREGAKPMKGFVVVDAGGSRRTPSSRTGSTAAPTARSRSRRSSYAAAAASSRAEAIRSPCTDGAAASAPGESSVSGAPA